MPADPRIAAAASVSSDPTQLLMTRIADLERRVGRAEAGGSRSTFAGAGAPTLAAPDGAQYVDTSANRLYVRTSGVWRFTALT